MNASLTNIRGIQNNQLLNQRQQTQNQCTQQYTQQRDINVDPKNLHKVILQQKPCDKKMDVTYMNKIYDTLNNSQQTQRQIYWNNRTNQPYKNILPESEFKKEFKTKEDLVVYKINPSDKNKELIEKDLAKATSDITTHNRELRNKFSVDKKAEFKKEFEYNTVEKYTIKYNQENYKDMKMNVIDYFKKEQQELEKNKKNIDDIIEKVIANDMIDENISLEQVPTNIDKYIQRQKKI
jgi:hypothetical protein